MQDKNVSINVQLTYKYCHQYVSCKKKIKKGSKRNNALRKATIFAMSNRKGYKMW